MQLKQGINSYCDIEFAEEYISSDYQVSSIWNALSIETKTTILKTACRTLDSQAYLGCKINSEQSLAFPRNYSSTQNNTVTSSFYFVQTGLLQYDGEIPVDIQKAQCELSIEMIRTNKNSKLKDLIDLGIRDIKIDTLQFGNIQVGNRNKFSQQVIDLISPFTDSSFSGYWERA